MREVVGHHALAAAAVDEMIEADAVDTLFLDEIEDLVQLAGVMLVDREAQAHALPHGHAVLDALHRLLVGTLDAAELVVDILEPVQRNTDVAHADILDALRNLARDQRAVRGERRAHTRLLRILSQLEEIRTDQRLAAREEQHGHAKFCEVVDELLRLVRRELVLIFLRIRTHIAMHALQVAGLRRVPDDDGAHALRRAVTHAVRILCIAQFVSIIVSGKKQFRYTDHIFSPKTLT